MVGRRWVTAMLVTSFAACSPDPRTQTMVVVDADPGVRMEARLIRIEVWGGPSGEPPTFIEPALELPVPGWPVTHAVIPRGDDASRRFRVEVTVLDRTGGRSVAHARAVAGFAEAQTRAIHIRLYDDCIDREACPDDQTCVASGACASAERDLVPYDPTSEPDGGGGVGDAGGMDGGASDDGGPSDAGTDAPIGDAGCTSEADCDDGIDCTEDLCQVGGTCRNLPDHTRCEPSGADCLAAPQCVAGTGCVEDLAPNGSACPGGTCWCGGCWLHDACGSCGGGSCDCLENDCQTPACMSAGLCS